MSPRLGRQVWKYGGNVMTSHPKTFRGLPQCLLSDRGGRAVTAPSSSIHASDFPIKYTDFFKTKIWKVCLWQIYFDMDTETT